MNRFTLFACILGFASSACLAQDAAKVDPAHHKIVLENGQVRVLRITFGPGEKAPLHEHPASVAINLVDSRLRISPEGGTVTELPRKRGDAVDVAAVKHTVENIGTTKADLILVETKTGPGATAVVNDAVKIDPKHYSVLLENDRFRVLKIHYGPKEKSIVHDHPASVAVFLTDADFSFTGPDASARPAKSKAGDAVWEPAESHLPQNMGDQGADVILVELKTKPAATE